MEFSSHEELLQFHPELDPVNYYKYICVGGGPVPSQLSLSLSKFGFKLVGTDDGSSQVKNDTSLSMGNVASLSIRNGVRSEVVRNETSFDVNSKDERSGNGIRKKKRKEIKLTLGNFANNLLILLLIREDLTEILVRVRMKINWQRSNRSLADSYI
jgi:hypothetical protein